MGHIPGDNRYQVKAISLDEMVDEKHIVRVVDKFIDITDLGYLGFNRVIPNELGRDSYHPAHLAKLIVFGSISGVRTSRKLEALTKESLPAMWLLDGLQPDHKSISDFRRNNSEALTTLFDAFNAFLLSETNVFGKSVVAIDGTKTKASNNKKNYVTVKKTIQMIAYHTDRFEECLAALDDVDADRKLKEIIEGMTKAINGIELYLNYQQILDESNSNALSLVDPDARMMKNGTDGYEIAYNV